MGPGGAPGAEPPPVSRRRPWLPLAGLVLTAAELVAFLALGSAIGFGWTVLLILALSVAGVVLLRREGLRAWRRFRQAATTGTPPGPHVTDGVVGLGGALLLASPGLVSGALGAVLLLPPVRGLAQRRMRTRAERWMSSAQAGQVFGPRRVRVQQSDPPATDAEVVEGEIVDSKDASRPER